MAIIENTTLLPNSDYLSRLYKEGIQHVIELTPDVLKIISSSPDPKATLDEMGYI